MGLQKTSGSAKTTAQVTKQPHTRNLCITTSPVESTLRRFLSQWSAPIWRAKATCTRESRPRVVGLTPPHGRCQCQLECRRGSRSLSIVPMHSRCKSNPSNPVRPRLLALRLGVTLSVLTMCSTAYTPPWFDIMILTCDYPSRAHQPMGRLWATSDQFTS